METDCSYANIFIKSHESSTLCYRTIDKRHVFYSEFRILSSNNKIDRSFSLSIISLSIFRTNNRTSLEGRSDVLGMIRCLGYFAWKDSRRQERQVSKNAEMVRHR